MYIVFQLVANWTVAQARQHPSVLQAIPINICLAAAMHLTMKRMLAIFVYVQAAQGAPKRGVRKRLMDEVDLALDEPEGIGSSSSSSANTRSLRARIAESQPAPEILEELPLANNLKRDCAIGNLFARQVQEHNTGAEAQGAAGVGNVAAAGARGQHPQNIQRTLINLFGRPMGRAQCGLGGDTNRELSAISASCDLATQTLPIPVQQSEGVVSAVPSRPTWCGAGVLAEDSRPRVHAATSGSARGRLAAGDPNRDAWRCRRLQQARVPSCYILQQPFGFGNTRRKRLVFTFLKKSECTPETLSALMRLFAWSVNAMLDGVCPDSGEPLAAGWRGCLCQIRGDWQWYCELFRFPAWNGAERMCWICAASATIAALLFKKCGEAAGWRATRVSHEEYVAGLEEIGADLPTLFKHVVGLRIECVVIDALHALDWAHHWQHTLGVHQGKDVGRSQPTCQHNFLEADLRCLGKES